MLLLYNIRNKFQKSNRYWSKNNTFLLKINADKVGYVDLYLPHIYCVQAGRVYTYMPGEEIMRLGVG
jgi:hypothetical protein